MAGKAIEFYQQFESLLRQMQEELDRREMAELRKSLQSGQVLFQAHLHDEQEEESETAIPGIDPGKSQSITTEMNKNLRLLNTDVMFLQAARQGQTVEQRISQVGDRLNCLLQYCQFVLENAQDPPA
jgi:hypothetical protein